MKRLIREAWRCLPAPLRRIVLRCLTSVLSKPLEPNRKLLKGPIIVAGFMGTATGLGQSARQMLKKFQNLGMRVYSSNISRFAVMEDFEAGDLWPLNMPKGGVVIFHVNPDMLNLIFSAIGRKNLEERRMIGLWAWELGTVPKQWINSLSSVDEVWVPSQFIADGLRKHAGEKPIYVVPNSIDVLAMPTKPRRDILPQFSGRPLVFFMYDVRSNHARKNPEAVIEAFKRATVGNTNPVLVIKINNDHAQPESLQKVRAATQDMSNVYIMREKLSHEEMNDLLARMDIIISLHRSEGFGFLMAEGMAAGKPVIATGWSGNTDFMTTECSILVDYKLVPVHDPEHVYDKYDAVWAEPNIEQAAKALRDLLGDPTERHRLGLAARAHIEAFASTQNWMTTLPPSFWNSLLDDSSSSRTMLKDSTKAS